MSIFSNINGQKGRVLIKGLGSVVAEVDAWSLSKPEEDRKRKRGYDLFVKFSFVVPSLLTDPDYNESRELRLNVGKSRTIKIVLDNPERMALTGRILRMEGVDIEWVEA